MPTTLEGPALALFDQIRAAAPDDIHGQLRELQAVSKAAGFTDDRAEQVKRFLFGLHGWTGRE